MFFDLANWLVDLTADMFVARERSAQGKFAQPGEPSTRRHGGHVVCYHPHAREIGESILARGGNAFDAFIATTAAENVLSEGASSLAGALGALIYRADVGRVTYLDADHNDPLDPTTASRSNKSAAGAAALVPGAPAALDALALKYGRLPLDVLLAPAIALAEDGFPASRLMVATIAQRSRFLRRTAYGRRTYLRKDKPPRVGDKLRLPEMADWLRRFAQERSSYVYHGGFGRRFIETVQAQGGRLTQADLAGYGERWCVPWAATFRDLTLHACSGRTYGGLWAMLALKTLERASVPDGVHYSKDADALERVIRIAREVWSEQLIFEDVVEQDAAAVQNLLTKEHAGEIWQRVVAQRPARAVARRATHSFHIITTDAEGNIASGTTTAQSEPWAEGLFVDGLLLTASGRIPFGTVPGRRRLSSFSMHLAMLDGRPVLSVGGISNSAAEAAFQLIVNIADGMPLDRAVRAPRVGTFPLDVSQRPRLDRNWIDPRIDPSIARTLRRRGLRLTSAGAIDTGLGAVLSLEDEGTSVGATVPLPYLTQPFSTSATEA
jgi:gamma-glutamyltranspeptidase/glutathione hydrolase